MNKPLTRRLAALLAAGTAALALSASTLTGTAAADPAPAADDPVPLAGQAAAPYLYYGWGSPPNATQIMAETGVTWFTLAFILSDGSCNPAWDGNRPLNGADAQRINEIRAAGGDVIPSFGGWAGNKLGEFCSTPEALAGAYQRVIDAYDLRAIDIDIEASEFENEAVQDRVLNALRIVKERNPGIQTIVTMGTGASGPNWWGQRLVRRGAELNAQVDVWTLMPFNFGGGSDMGQATITAMEGLKNQLMSTHGYSEAEAYRHMGISSMNGVTDVGETITQAHFQTMLNYVRTNSLGRFTFWSLNRDRPCAGDPSACSGIGQQPWEFTRIIAQYNG
ncbi:chitinase [Allonocardiopsis opalescens]|uniref:Glycosyl hydrolase family 18 (Putative chitinase) n=1 Tax=Allonocardiopsis opalescens TaxID=1144618 RepID=A0A2T0QCP9_9ACTN|nr:chitinase [Allonocardiopsis opalescens]PRY01682.1 glycosyl hydrolase family 18 (putative chitinase) [Allonocardiopsis opalescens]